MEYVIAVIVGGACAVLIGWNILKHASQPISTEPSPCYYCETVQDHAVGCPDSFAERADAKIWWDEGYQDGKRGERALRADNPSYMLGYRKGESRRNTLLSRQIA